MKINEAEVIRYVGGVGILLTAVVVLVATIAPRQSVFSSDPGNVEPQLVGDIAPIPVATGQVHVASTSAETILVYDPESSTVLSEKEADTPRYPASTTKIMTALVALETYTLDEQVIITDASRSVGHTADLIAGEVLTVRDVLAALMIPSGNDAAVALAQHHPQGYEHFLKLMNLKAQQLSMRNTRYANVSGIEAADHYMSARDLALLTKTVMENPEFRSLVATKEMRISSVDGSYTHDLVNLNELLGTVDGVVGVKTGWTNQAGECLVTYTVRDDRPIIVVVMGSEDRFGDSKALIEWAYASHAWMTMDELVSVVTEPE
jgi:serine-type D-Ala-D-Ala carboxypeptidase (penicillin-binding protein 5/6)